MLVCGKANTLNLDFLTWFTFCTNFRIRMRNSNETLIGVSSKSCSLCRLIVTSF